MRGRVCNLSIRLPPCHRLHALTIPPPPPSPRPWPQPPDVFLQEQLERAAYVLLSPGDASLAPALRDLPSDWRGVLAAYGADGSGGGGGGDVGSAAASHKGAGRYVLSVQFDPFHAELYAGDELAVSANRR